MYTIPANKFHRMKFQQNSSFNTASSKDQQTMFQAKKGPQRHLQALRNTYLVPSHMSSSKCPYTRPKQHLHATQTFSSQGYPHGTFQAET